MSKPGTHEFDRRGLIRESYRIAGIDDAACRTIFLDWALGAGEDPPQRDQIAVLLELYGTDAPDHPMTAILREGLARYDAPKGRRGGRKGRRAD